MTTKAKRDQADLWALIRQRTMLGEIITISLDASSTSVGYAVWQSGLCRYASTLLFDGGLSRRIAQAHNEIRALLSLWRPSGMVSEAPAYSRFETVAQQRVMGAIILAAEGVGIPFDPDSKALAPNTVKKAFTGNGRADKDAMISVAMRYFIADGRHGYLDEHAADAIAVGVAFGFGRKLP